MLLFYTLITVTKRDLEVPFILLYIAKKNGPSVETERPLTIACHMKIFEVKVVLTITA
jgi:hypothetical protein